MPMDDNPHHKDDDNPHHKDDCPKPEYLRLKGAKVPGVVRCKNCGLISWEEAVPYIQIVGEGSI